MNKKRGFTLVELLAVIVILAIILVIAVPKIMNTIESARIASLETSVKVVAAEAENQFVVAQTLGKLGTGEGEFNVGSPTDMVQCGDWAGINNTDYKSCKYYISSDGVAHVTIEGNGKFDKLVCRKGTRTEVSCQKLYAGTTGSGGSSTSSPPTYGN